MKVITLRHTLPVVFAESPPSGSDVWLAETTFRRGEKYLIEAASGTGKSSLCGYLYGYRRDYAGEILFDECDVRRLTKRQWSVLRNTSLAMMFQDMRLFPELTALENVRIKNNLTRHKTEEQIAQLFEELSITEKRDSLVGKLSLGQQQRVAFVRMLCQKADFMLLDEPVSHLDDANAGAMARVLEREAAAEGCGIVITSIGKHFEMSYDKTLAL
ncbi:MAG: ATP-binding cassette domain-containing protein [Rikenellaceae bacterium]|nr:ATP-binding cassette domain-containing protein [Rikenellaceae bacterium]MCL2692458.1 ATP-binding cassette domain-containing protein [Rikenellaceae bacterium]